MSMIEKLGMETPDELREVGDVWKVFELAGFPTRQIGNDLFRDGENIKKILDDKNEMLEALIKLNITAEGKIAIDKSWKECDQYPTLISNIELIEKITGLSWEKIKELIK